ncbi:metal-dependent transcriptional regulator [Natronobacterium gregoryi]|uniref:Metal-dependent transcriptional regulator n=2 Tax=Natronobacterium gregoryi TaxID=44930 RepID=L0ADY0_NATGS|nr:metal-dependent transcriptional regulator [Natronobacterium gregoryi]AFZ71357.1 Mn-dependent transcriptional regulator [Natronobacterium gregoryi SP2]ELY67012.1 transcription repressor [Natronobacterium gregoryi SP2]PLK21262.1 metal-dependent transcriptional regulator [Natronobacterium gregoryi SP2]SFI85482.1 iron (metal) dependent repressor, DtxR family [Natronobacterium gregoryi]
MDLSPIAEDYLTVIYRLESEHGRPVRTAEIGDEIGVTAPSVTSMLDNLNEEGLVDYTPYEGVELTEEGELVVRRLIRNHRLLETFLTDHLGYDWTEVHEEADRLEHHVSDELARRLSAFLGDPATDSHGDPIPNADLTMPEETPYTPLSECEAGETVVVEQVPHRDPDVREFLSDAGVGPGTRITIDDVPPVDLLIVELESEGHTVTLPIRVARRIGTRSVDDRVY